MIKFLYKLLLTFNSTILIIVVYMIKEQIVFSIPLVSCEHISYLIYLLISMLFSGICLWVSRFLSSEIITGGIKEIELANNSYLPSYLGYFFVALGVNDIDTLIWTFLIIFLFTFDSKMLLFNPMFLLFGYKFYSVSMESGMKIFIITREHIKDIHTVKFDEIKRINDYTYIDRGNKG